MPTVRERLERGYGMRAQRLTEGGLLATAILSGDLRPAWLAFAFLAAQAVLSPLLSPIAVAWAVIDRRLPADRLGNLYFDMGGSRGAAAVSCAVMLSALVLVELGWRGAGLFLLGLPCASCLLSATVGFCAGCGYYVLGRDVLMRLRGAERTPPGATDVQFQNDQ